MESDVTTLVIEIGNALRVRTFLNQNIYILASRDTHSHSTDSLGLGRALMIHGFTQL